MEDESCVLSGWLHRKWKSGGMRRKWERLWFELRGSFLFCFTAEQTEASKQATHDCLISLKDAEINVYVHRHRKHCLELLHKERRPLLLQAESAASMREWMHVIAVASAGPANAPASIASYYEVLGLNPTSDVTLRNIKFTYRKKALKNHPDKGGDRQVFQMISEAYEVLTAVKETESEERYVQLTQTQHFI